MRNLKMDNFLSQGFFVNYLFFYKKSNPESLSPESGGGPFQKFQPLPRQALFPIDISNLNYKIQIWFFTMRIALFFAPYRA
jgi:hypothetical protein